MYIIYIIIKSVLKVIPCCTNNNDIDVLLRLYTKTVSVSLGTNLWVGYFIVNLPNCHTTYRRECYLYHSVLIFLYLNY